MKRVSSFSDHFLLKAASQYAYEVSFFPVYQDPILTVTMNLKNDYLNRYVIELCENKAFIRDDRRINLRYILFKDTSTNEYALVFQGSDGDITEMFSGEDVDWSNNLNIVAHLPLPNYELAKAEFEYLKNDKNYNITAVSGNSLGGGYALYIADYYPDVKAVGLNPAPREFNERFKENQNSLLVTTSSDILSRSLSLDIARLKGEPTVEFQSQRETLSRMKDAYGIEPYVIRRSIPYISNENISIGHLGALRNYRKPLLKIYNENFIYYNANIIAKHKEWKSFSKYLLQTTFKQLEQKDYREFTEDYIYPSLTDNAKGIVNTYMYYPQIDDFSSFDIKTMNLLNANGEPLDSKHYEIEDHFSFINNLNKRIKSYQKTQLFFIHNSIFELQTIFDNAGLSYSKHKFISSSLKLRVDWDWVFAKLFIDMPLPVKMQTGEFIERNLSFVYRMSNKLSSEYTIATQFSQEDIEDYVNDLIKAFYKFEDLNEQMYTIGTLLSTNFEMILLEQKMPLLKTENLYEQSASVSLMDVTDLKKLSLDIIAKQYKAAQEAIKSVSDIAEEDVIDIAASFIKILEVILAGLEVEKSKEDEKILKLHQQTEALLKNVDLKSFLVMALYEYQEDILAYLLRDSVAIVIQYNMIQMIEANNEYIKQLKNIERYINKNIKIEKQDVLNKDIQKLYDLIENQNKHLKNILK